jgi:hypothetical protein
MAKLTAEQKKLITDTAILETIEEQERELAQANYESADRRTKLKDADSRFKSLETNHNAFREKIKKLGFDPDVELDEQFEKITKEKGLRPSSDVDALTKKIQTLTDKITAQEAATVLAQHEASIEKASNLFDPLLKDTFDKSADVVKELLKLKGKIALKDGVPGILRGEEFIPLEAESGSVSAIDIIKKEYANLVVAKQKPGSGSSPNNRSAGGKENEMIDRATFETLSPDKKFAYMSKIGQLSDNVTE